MEAVSSGACGVPRVKIGLVEPRKKFPQQLQPKGDDILPGPADKTEGSVRGGSVYRGPSALTEVRTGTYRFGRFEYGSVPLTAAAFSPRFSLDHGPRNIYNIFPLIL